MAAAEGAGGGGGQMMFSQHLAGLHVEFGAAG